MPVIPTTAYATVESVLDLARAKVNDMMVSTAGEILTDTAPFTFPMLNDAASYFTRKLRNRGYKTFVKETILTPITAIAVADPGTQVNISDTGYYDGVTNANPPQLPTDLTEPQVLWERQTGSVDQWSMMVEWPDGLPSVVQTIKLGMWEWRQDAIYMPGATQSNDIRLRYISIGATFVSPTDSLLIRDATSALANLLAAVFVNSRSPAMAQSFAAAGDEIISDIALENTRARQRETITRRPYGGSRQGYWK